MNGISEFLLTSYYLRRKKEFKNHLPEALQDKIKSTFDVINKKQENEYVEENN